LTGDIILIDVMILSIIIVHNTCKIVIYYYLNCDMIIILNNLQNIAHTHTILSRRDIKTSTFVCKKNSNKSEDSFYMLIHF